MSRFLALAILCCLASACTFQVDRKYLPPPLTDDGFEDPTKVVAVPLPVIITDPNEGPSYGALTAFLLHDKENAVRTMIVPQTRYNEYFGQTGSVYGAFFFDQNRELEVTLSQSQNVNRDYEARFKDKTLLDNKLELQAFIVNSADGSQRFFGLQAKENENETNYSFYETGFTLSAGYDVAESWQVVVSERFRDVDIRSGVIDTLPDITTVFSPEQVPGIEGYSTHAQGLAVIRSTLDHPDMPTSGTHVRAGVEGSAKALGSSADFWKYGLEAKGFFPLDDDSRYVLAVRGAYMETKGLGAPFLERATLGGENSLRGYGRGRFVGDAGLLLNVEARLRLFRWEVFDVDADWELAPFVDMGSVMETLGDIEDGAKVFTPGIGFRAVVRPKIIGRVDIGFGREGMAIFTGLGYPF